MTVEVKPFDDIAIRRGIGGDGFMGEKATASRPTNANNHLSQKRFTGCAFGCVTETGYTCGRIRKD